MWRGGRKRDREEEEEARQRGDREGTGGDLPIIKSGAHVEMVCHRLALLELPAVEVNDVAHLPR